MKAFSNSLKVATEGQLSLGKVSVLMPDHWTSRACPPPGVQNAAKELPSSGPHIFVDEPHAVLGHMPWTQQPSDCGIPGDFIQMGVEFLRAANVSKAQAARSGRIMSAEWAKYRWGVFSESGFQGDLLYPPWYHNGGNWMPTLCTDSLDPQISPCNPEERHHCTLVPSPEANSSSSLLALPHLPQVTRFCSPENHVEDAPTKQNSLCLGRSVLEIIRKSSDFRNLRKRKKVEDTPLPSLHFMRAPLNRFVLLVEDTGDMNVQRRWDFVRKAIRRAVVYDLPDAAQVAIIVFNANTREVAPLSTLESVSDLRERVGSSLPRNPSSVRASQACIMCGLRAALSVFSNANVSTHGANVILLTSGNQKRANEAQEVEEIIESHGLRLILVLYPFQERPGTPAPPHALVSIAYNTGGTVFTIMDEGVGNDSKISMLVALMEALTAAILAGGSRTPVLVHSATYPGGMTSISSGLFFLDELLLTNAKFSVYYYDLNHVGNTIHLIAPSGTTFASVNMQEEDGDVNMIFVNLHNAERGLWKYKVENRADSHQGLHIQVTSLPNPANDVTVRVWTNQGVLAQAVSDQPHPIIIYGEIKVRGNPVMGAGVLVTLHRLGTNITGGTYPPVEVELLDLGTGDPDITKGEGIYSRYAPPLDGPARYSLTMTVDATKAVLPIYHSRGRLQNKDHESDHRRHRHIFAREGYLSTQLLPYIASPSFAGQFEGHERHFPGSVFARMAPCCGSALPFTHTKQCPPFTREITGPTVDIASSSAASYPPSRITDLVAWVNTSTGYVVLEWTAVGETLDWGKADHYIAIATNSKMQAMIPCSGRAIGGLPRPSPSGYRERTIVSLDVDERKSVYVCLRAVDKAGRKGPPSNPAPVWTPRPPATDRVTDRNQGVGFGGVLGEEYNGKAAVISGIVGGLLLVVVLVAGYCYCMPTGVALRHDLQQRRQREDEEEKDMEERNGPSLINGGSVIKSASRGSVIVNTDRNTLGFEKDQNRNGIHVQTDQPTNKDTNGSELQQFSQRAPSAPPERRHLSIPDVTKVDSHSEESSEKFKKTEPQFFTLGRHHSQAKDWPYQDDGRNQLLRRSSEASVPQDPYLLKNSLSSGTAVGNGMDSGSFRCNAIDRRSDTSLFLDGSTEGGESLTEALFCDDRNVSPPPPAPGGSEYIPFKRQSLILM